MYGKIFTAMYEGTLYGRWEAIVTFQQMIVLADEDGTIDMTPPAIAAKTSIPLEIIEKGIEILSQEDKYSRSAAEEGRRIVLLDANRPWGWQIVNYRYYRDLASREDKKRKDRERIAEKRKENRDVADCRDVSRSVADVAHTDTDTDTDKKKNMSGKPDPAPRKKKNKNRETAKSILGFLNDKAGKNHQPVDGTLRPIVARLDEGATETQCRQIIARKVRKWATDEKMQDYLRPKTLFARENFWNYVGELVPPKEENNGEILS